jgi:hypothetical protein
MYDLQLSLSWRDVVIIFKNAINILSFDPGVTNDT